MKLSRGWSWFLIAFGVWSWIIWPTFIKNIANDKRSFSGDSPHAFFIVHLLLTVVSLALGTAIGFLGIKGLRAEAKKSRTNDLEPVSGVQTGPPTASDSAVSRV